LDDIKGMEASQQRLLRLTGGNMELVAKAIDGDPSVPPELRSQIMEEVNLNADNMRRIHGILGDSSNQAVTGEEAARVEEQARQFRESRMQDFNQQSDAMLEDLAKFAGMDVANMSDAEKQAAKAALGGPGENKRTDLMLAIEARKRMDAAIAAGRAPNERDVKLAGRLGSLGSSGVSEDGVSLVEALREFGPEGSGTKNGEKPAFTITGVIKIPGVGEGPFEGEGRGD
jgi:hypothetical protein